MNKNKENDLLELDDQKFHEIRADLKEIRAEIQTLHQVTGLQLRYANDALERLIVAVETSQTIGGSSYEM